MAEALRRVILFIQGLMGGELFIKRFLSVVSGILFLLLAISFFSRLTMPKYVGGSREGNLISEYYVEIKAKNRHDVIFVGDCEAYSSFVPPILWEKYGITSFVRGSPSQTLAQSVALISETLSYERPRAIVLSVYALCRDERSSEAYNRMTLDGMRFSIYKLRAVRESIGKDESIISYFLPLLRFHSRWKELSADDFKYLFSRPRVSHNGYLMEKGVVPCETDEFENTAYAPPLPQENMQRLSEITKECQEKGVELILVKSPLCSWRYPWYAEWDCEIEKFAEQNGIKYYNLMYFKEEIGLDMKHDTYDGGLHLNLYGAEKVTAFFGEVLASEHGINPKHDVPTESVWEKKTEEYYKERNR